MILISPAKKLNNQLIENKLNISIPEEETFDLQTVQQLLEVVGKHNVQD